MVGVPRPLRVTWLVDGEATHEAVLAPWTGGDSAPAETVVEEAATRGELEAYRRENRQRVSD
jgi:hypothetical protein